MAADDKTQAGINSATKSLQGLDKSAKGIGSSLGKVDQFLGVFSKGAAAAAGIGAVGAALNQVVTAASEVQQATGSVETIFKGQSQQVIEGAKSWQAYGLSQAQALQSSALLGNQLTQLGYSGEQLTGTTDKLLMTAADMAATFGGTTVGALEALQAALRGSYARLDEYGVNISATQVTAEAAAQGIGKQQAALNLIFGQTALFAGQATRELDTYAGAQQATAAAVENAKAAIGEGLLPVATKAQQAMGLLAGAFGQIPPAVYTGATAVAVAVGGYKALAVGLARGRAALLAYEASALAAARANYALTASTFRGSAAAALANILKPGPLLAAAAAIGAVQFAMNKINENARAGLRDVEAWVRVLAEPGAQVAETTSDIFDQAKSIEQLAAASKRGNWEQLALFFGGDWAEFGTRGASTEEIERLAQAIAQVGAVDPSRAREEFVALESALYNAGYSAEEVRDILGVIPADIRNAAEPAQTLAEKFKEASDAASALRAEIEALGQASVDLSLAQADYAEAVAESAKNINKGGGLKANTEAGRENRRVLANQRDALFDLIEAQDASGASNRKLVATMRQGRQDFINAAVAAGITRKAARDLATEWGLVPKRVKTTVEEQGAAAAAAAARRLAGDVRSIPTQWVTYYRLVASGNDPGRVKPGANFEGQGAGRSSLLGLGSTRAEIAQFASPLNAISPRQKNYWQAYVRKYISDLDKVIKAEARKIARTGKGSIDLDDVLGLKIPSGVKKKKRKEIEDFYGEQIKAAQQKLRELAEAVRDAQRANREAFRESIFEGIDLGDAFSGAKDSKDKIAGLNEEIAELQKQYEEAGTAAEDYSKAQEILNQLAMENDPGKRAQLEKQYQQALANPATTADIERQNEILAEINDKKAEIQELEKSDTAAERIQQQVDNTKAFGTALDTLREKVKQGILPPDAFAEIVNMGPEVGLEVAQGLVDDEALLTQWASSYESMAQYAKNKSKNWSDGLLTTDVKQAQKALGRYYNRMARINKDLEERIKKRWDVEVNITYREQNATKKGGRSSQATGRSAPINITVNGAIDAEGTARTIERVMRQHAVRVGA